MRRKIICLLPKSPRPKRGRIGPENWQEWYRGCLLAVKLSKKYGWDILIPSNFEIPQEKYVDGDFYFEVLTSMGITGSSIRRISEGVETVQQLQTAVKFADSTGNDLLIVWSSLPHRLRWIFIKSWLRIPNGLKIFHRTSLLGIPRPKEWLRDWAILPVLLAAKIHPRLENLVKRKILSFVYQIRAEGRI